jgi:hypothetical protein
MIMPVDSSSSFCSRPRCSAMARGLLLLLLLLLTAMLLPRAFSRVGHWWGVRGALTPLASPPDPSGLPAGLRQPYTGGSAPRARSRLWLTGR